MQFAIVERIPSGRKLRSEAFLIEDRWDDWGKYRTQFALVIFDDEGVRHDIGSVKIGQVGLKPSRTVGPGQRAPEIKSPFAALGPKHFSLGQDETYFEALWALGGTLAEEVLKSLRDVAFDLALYEKHGDEDVMGESLMRFVADSTVRGKFQRLATGDPALSAFDFDFALAAKKGVESPVLEFRVTPYRLPPSNVHVIIGRNGVGKTRLLQGLAQSVVAPDEQNAIGTLVINDDADTWSFSGLIYVSFSAFDDFKLPPPKDSVFRAAQVSLTGGGSVSPKDGKPTKTGAAQFAASLGVCRRGLRRQRWIDAVSALESDPLFKAIEVVDLADVDADDWKARATELYGNLSSGHAVVLLTITKLVELVDEKALVLIDEPEGHLHPPLLSALVRSISSLLTKRNAVAIIATHSPVVLQEVPSRCVWRLRRSGPLVNADRPTIQTFGGNVGVLTNEVFGLEVTSSGFHTLLESEIAAAGSDYDAVIHRFNGQLGSDARAIARGLTAVSPDDDDGG